MATRKDQHWLEFWKCRCGWVGSGKQLSLLVQKNKIAAKICPVCSSKQLNSLSKQLSPSSELIH